MTPGTYFISAHLPGYQTLRQTLVIEAATNAPVVVNMELHASTLAALNSAAEKQSPAAFWFKANKDALAALVLAPSDDGGMDARLAVQEKGSWQNISIPPGDVVQQADLFMRQANLPPPPIQPAQESESVIKKWQFWAIVGGAAALGVVGGAYLLTRDGEAPATKFIVQP